MRRFPFRSLRTRLLLLVLLAVVPALGLILYNAWEDRRLEMADAQVDALSTLVRNLSGLGAAALLMLAVAWLAGDFFILRRVNELLAATRRIASGDLSARTSLPYGVSELSELSRAFDGMAGSLERREGELRQAEAKYRLLVEKMPAVAYTSALDEAGSTLYISPKIEEMTGFSPSEWIADKLWPKRLHPDDRERILAGYARFRAEGKPFRNEYRLIARDGRAVWVRDEGEVVQDASGRPQFVHGIAIDITESKLMEETLRRSRDELELRVRERTERLIKTNEALQAQIVKRKFVEEELRSAHDALELRVEQRTGYLIRANEALQAQIAERMRAEEALRESEERFRKIFEEGSLGMAIVGPDYRFIKANNRLCQMLGYTEQELTSFTFPDITHPEDIDRDVRLARRVFGGEIPYYQIEKRYIKKDKEILWINLTASVIKGKDGKPLYGLAMIEDITERKRSEEALRRGEARYRDLYEESPVAYLLVGPDGRIRRANRRALKLLGYGVSSLIGRSFFDLCADTPEYREKAQRIFLQLGSGDVAYDEEIKMQRADGRPIWVSLTARPIQDAEGNVVEGHLIAVDITDRKRMAEELRESQENFQRTVARVEDVIYSVDLGTHEFSFLSPAFERLLGYAPDDIRGMGGRRAFLSRVMQGGGFERQEGIVGQLLAEGRLSDASYRYEAWWLCKDGTLKCLEDRWVPIYDGESLVSTDGVLRDITDRKQAEKELRTHAHQQAVVTELGQMALARADLSQLMDEATSLLAQSLAVEYSKVLELLPDGKSLLLRAGVGWKEGYVGHATVGAGTESQAGYTLLCSKPVIVEDLRTETRFSGPPLLHDHGVVSGISTVIHGKDRPFGVLGAHTTRRRTFTKDDVHFLQALASVLATAIERKRAEDALTEERNLLRTLMDNLPDYIFIKDTKSRYVIDNDVRIRIMGARTSEEVVGKTDFDFFPRELAEKYYADDQSVIRSGQPLFGREEPVIDPSGNRVWFLTTRVPLRDSSGKIVGLVGTSRDITEDKKLREELARSEKLSAIGQIAAGIAHEIRNPLGSIVTAAHLLSLRERMAVKGDNLKLLRTIKFEAKRLNGILTDFLTFARPRKLHLRESDVNEILEDVLSLIKSDPALSLKVSIQEKLQPSLPQIRIDRDQIKQVIWNIALNALQAMPEGGKLRVASEVGDGHLKVRVRDSGVGISQDDLGRIFQPFYTSKKGGTGLGLSIAHRIVEAHGGSIDVKTKVGRGTEFTITLPMR